MDRREQYEKATNLLVWLNYLLNKRPSQATVVNISQLASALREHLQQPEVLEFLFALCEKYAPNFDQPELALQLLTLSGNDEYQIAN